MPTRARVSLAPVALALATMMAACATGPSAVYTISKRAFPPPVPRAQAERQIGGTIDHERLSLLVIERINEFRAENNLAALIPDPDAMRAAQWMADYQARRATVTHVAETPGMQEFGQRYRHFAGQSDAFGAENAGSYSLFDPSSGRVRTYDEMARHMVREWKNSPDHRKALLGSAPGEGIIGVGVVRAPYKGSDNVFATMDLFYFPEPPSVVMARERMKARATAKSSAATKP